MNVWEGRLWESSSAWRLSHRFLMLLPAPSQSVTLYCSFSLGSCQNLGMAPLHLLSFVQVVHVEFLHWFSLSAFHVHRLCFGSICWGMSVCKFVSFSCKSSFSYESDSGNVLGAQTRKIQAHRAQLQNDGRQSPKAHWVNVPFSSAAF